MTYWHIMVIVVMLSGGDETYVSIIPFSDEKACGDAIPAVFEAVNADSPGSYVMCKRTDILSGVMVLPETRPQRQ